jgi:hypothetical protein
MEGRIREGEPDLRELLRERRDLRWFHHVEVIYYNPGKVLASKVLENRSKTSGTANNGRRRFIQPMDKLLANWKRGKNCANC